MSKLLGNVMNNSLQYYRGECLNYYQIMAMSDFVSICNLWILSVLTSSVLYMVILKLSFEYWPERSLILYWSSTLEVKNWLFGLTRGIQSVYLYILFLSLFVWYLKLTPGLYTSSNPFSLFLDLHIKLVYVEEKRQ